jgi:hypothetical protein
VRLQDMRNDLKNCILVSALCFELPGTAGSGSLDWLFLDLPLRTENDPTQSLQIPDRCRDQRRRRTLTGRQNVSTSTKTTPYFYKKARSAFLLYKFYKFMAHNLLLIKSFICLKLGIQPLKLGIQPLKLGIQPIMLVYQGVSLAYWLGYGKNNASSCRSRL